MAPRSDIAGAVELRTRDLDGLTALDGHAAVDEVLRILSELQDVFAGSGSPAAGFHHLYVATTTEVARRLAAGAFEAPDVHLRARRPLRRALPRRGAGHGHRRRRAAVVAGRARRAHGGVADGPHGGRA